MATRMILKNGDPQLRKHCHEVKDFNPRLHMLLDDMRQTLAESNGVGLAAPQVGVLRRAICVDVGDENGLFQLINPEIVKAEGEQEGMEGCLSIPKRHGIVKRPARVTVRATTRAGKPVEIEAEGLLAVAFCHEIDHLDGTMYIDKQEREVTDEELAEMQKENKE